MKTSKHLLAGLMIIALCSVISSSFGSPGDKKAPAQTETVIGTVQHDAFVVSSVYVISSPFGIVAPVVYDLTIKLEKVSSASSFEVPPPNQSFYATFVTKPDNPPRQSYISGYKHIAFKPTLNTLTNKPHPHRLEHYNRTPFK